MHADGGLGRARPARDEADTRAPGQLAVGLGHVRGARLVPAGDQADRRVVEAVEHGRGSSRPGRRRRARRRAPRAGRRAAARRRESQTAARGTRARAAASASPRRPGRRSGSCASPPTRAGSTSTRTKAVSSVAEAVCEDGIGAGLVPPLERGVVVRHALRLDANACRSAGQRKPGPGWVCRWATLPGGKSTRSQRTSQSPAGRSARAPRRARGRRPAPHRKRARSASTS